MWRGPLTSTFCWTGSRINTLVIVIHLSWLFPEFQDPKSTCLSTTQRWEAGCSLTPRLAMRGHKNQGRLKEGVRQHSKILMQIGYLFLFCLFSICFSEILPRYVFCIEIYKLSKIKLSLIIIIPVWALDLGCCNLNFFSLIGGIL